MAMNAGRPGRPLFVPAEALQSGGGLIGAPQSPVFVAPKFLRTPIVGNPDGQDHFSKGGSRVESADDIRARMERKIESDNALQEKVADEQKSLIRQLDVMGKVERGAMSLPDALRLVKKMATDTVAKDLIRIEAQKIEHELEMGTDLRRTLEADPDAFNDKLEEKRGEANQALDDESRLLTRYLNEAEDAKRAKAKPEELKRQERRVDEQKQLRDMSSSMVSRLESLKGKTKEEQKKALDNLNEKLQKQLRRYKAAAEGRTEQDVQKEESPKEKPEERPPKREPEKELFLPTVTVRAFPTPPTPFPTSLGTMGLPPIEFPEA
jgi:hypothetical protein